MSIVKHMENVISIFRFLKFLIFLKAPGSVSYLH